MENKKIKILAIDDNRDNLISLKAIISEVIPQSVVYEELSGQGGIESARKNDPDVILLDIVMPGMDGYEVCRILKADEQLSETPIIFLTALKGDKQSRILALEAKGEAFLSKPIDESELKAQVLAMVKIKEAATYKSDQRFQLEDLVKKRTEELMNANIAALNLLEDLKTENEIRKQSEAALRESEKQYAFLAETAFDLVKFTSVQNIYEYTARKLYELMEGKGIVAIVEYDSNSNLWKMQHLKGIDDKYTNLSKIFGFDIRKLEGEISSKYYEKIISGKLEEVEIDFPGLFNNKVSDKIGNTVIKLLSVAKMYCIAFYESERVFGNITLVTKKNAKPLNADLIEAFVLQVTNYVKKQKSEEALRESEEKFRRITDNITDVVWTTDLNFNGTYISPSVYKLAGFTADEYLKMSLDKKHPPTTLQGFQDLFSQEMQKENDPAVDKNRTMVVEGEHYKADGSIIIVSMHVSLIRDEDGNPIGIQGVTSDITERKQAEENLKNSKNLLAETELIGKVGGWSFNIDTLEQKWTDEVYRIHEVEISPEPGVDAGINYYTKESRPIIGKAVQRAIEHGENYDLELEIITAKGNTRAVHTLGKADLKNRRIYGFFQDITERKLAEAKLQREQAFYMDLVNALPAGMYRLSVKPDVKWSADNWRSQMGSQ